MERFLVVGVGISSLVLLVAVACTQTRTITQDGLQVASLIQLISEPERCDGVEVQVLGFIDIEQHAIFLMPEDAEHDITKNALWLHLAETSQHLLEEHSQSFYGKVEGVFEADNLGPGNVYSGTLRDITKINRM